MPILYDTPRLKIETKPVHLPNGRDREYLFVQPVSAVCILPTDAESVYLIRQYRAVIDFRQAGWSRMMLIRSLQPGASLRRKLVFLPVN